ncbi:MgtC/SapB family protein [Luteibacter sp. dw_328]|jgi:putative Mg2+ transporter-C (MgtC) family protein|uniref:MgtC/SapB family protein n=1 Tax=Luteibacter sp. dw_328 TaxID=2719796 RepID=UPI001BD49D2C|nr:MgtC/SapB family protein [Luteibacter sp. dw_328]
MIGPVDLLLRLLAAAVLSGVIGINRGRLEWTAGLRTHMLVAVGAALAIIVSAFGFADVLNNPHVVLDPSRIAAQVVTGVGFLGAGTILFVERDQIVRGLTTAASLWAVASVGLAAGSGMYAGAVMATAIIWVILALLKPLERRLTGKPKRRPRLTARLTGSSALSVFETALSEHHLPFAKTILRREPDGDDVVTVLFTRPVRKDQLAVLADALRDLEGFKSVSYDAPDEKARRS